MSLSAGMPVMRAPEGPAAPPSSTTPLVVRYVWSVVLEMDSLAPEVVSGATTVIGGGMTMKVYVFV